MSAMSPKSPWVDPAMVMRAGKPPHFHISSMRTITVYSKLIHFPEDYVRAVQSKRFSYIILKPRWRDHMKLVRAYYRHLNYLDDYYISAKGKLSVIKKAYEVLVPRPSSRPPRPPPVRYTPLEKMSPHRPMR